MSRSEDPPVHRDQDDIGCLAAIETFYAYLDGELNDPQSIADFENHMAHCRSCFSRAELERLLNERLKELATHHAPERLKSRLRNLMDRF
ncbi:MAG: anti-sigma factor family protein [Planctomycetota bacterium]|jgi:anti-sigma factor (TIGR02949 family)